MTAPLSREDYAGELRELLPRGAAWPRDPDTVLSALLDAFAGEFKAVDDAALLVIEESVPSGAFHTLGRWESMFGLPDACSSAAQTIQGRRAALVGKMVFVEGLTIADIEAFGARWGYTIRVREPGSEAEATGVTLDVTGGKWRFVWYVDIGTDAQIRFFQPPQPLPAPLAEFDADFPSEFVCRLRELVPAHTLLIVRLVPLED